MKNASESNALARKQMQENKIYTEKNNRPVLEVFIKDYKVNLNNSYLVDWTEEIYEFKPKYASSFYLDLKNIGNVTARNIQLSFYYEGIDNIIEQIKEDPKSTDLLEGKEVTIDHRKIQNGTHEFNQFILSERTVDNKAKRVIVDDASYLEFYGSLQPSSHDNTSIRIHIPNMYVYFTNIFASEIQDDDLILNLMLKVSYTNPYGEEYLQSFRVLNKVKHISFGSRNEIVGKFVMEEITNRKLEKD